MTQIDSIALIPVNNFHLPSCFCFQNNGSDIDNSTSSSDLLPPPALERHIAHNHTYSALPGQQPKERKCDTAARLAKTKSTDTRSATALAARVSGTNVHVYAQFREMSVIWWCMMRLDRSIWPHWQSCTHTCTCTMHNNIHTVESVPAPPIRLSPISRTCVVISHTSKK